MRSAALALTIAAALACYACGSVGSHTGDATATGLATTEAEAGSTAISRPAKTSPVNSARRELEIFSAASDVACQDGGGRKTVCRAQLTHETVTVEGRLVLRPTMHGFQIDSCETLRLISGSLAEWSCPEYVVADFDRWQAGPELPHPLRH